MSESKDEVVVVSVGGISLLKAKTNAQGLFELKNIFEVPTICYSYVDRETAERRSSLYTYMDGAPNGQKVDLSALLHLIKTALNKAHGVRCNVGNDNYHMQEADYDDDIFARGGLLRGIGVADRNSALVRGDENGYTIAELNFVGGLLKVEKNLAFISPQPWNSFTGRVCENNTVHFTVRVGGEMLNGYLHYTVPVTICEGDREEIERQIFLALTSMRGHLGPGFNLLVSEVSLAS